MANGDDALGRLKALKAELAAATDPARAKALREEMGRVTESIKGAEGAGGGFKGRLEQVKKVLDTIGPSAAAAFGTLTATIKSTVAVADPAAFYQFNLALRDMSAVIGQILSPVLDQMTALVRGVADWIINLDDGTKESIATMVTFATALTGVVVAAWALATAISAVAGAAALLNVSTGGLFVVLTAVAAVITTMVLGLSRTIDLMKWLLGMGPADDKAKAKKSSVGASGMGAGFISGEDVQRRAITAAFRGTSGKTDREVLEKIEKNTAATAKNTAEADDRASSSGGTDWESDRERW